MLMEELTESVPVFGAGTVSAESRKLNDLNKCCQGNQPLRPIDFNSVDRKESWMSHLHPALRAFSSYGISSQISSILKMGHLLSFLVTVFYCGACFGP